MEGSEQPAADLEDVQERLREMIRLRRQAEASSEHWLDGDPALQESPARDRALARIRHELNLLGHRSYLDPARITTESNLLGGSAFHRTIGRAVSRQTEGTMQQVHSFAEQTIATLQAIVDLLDDHLARNHQEQSRRFDEILTRLARFERATEGPAPDLAHLQRRVEELEAVEAGRGFRPSYRSEDFEDQFRGSREDLLARYRDIADRLIGCDPVVDIGFGRGEILELLAARGVESRGVEVDPVLVAAAQTRGLAASVGDGLATLAGCDDAALGGIVLIQVVEHLPAQKLLELIALAFDKLRVGGRLVMETVNPQSLGVFAHSFYLDPTHQRPVHPAYLEFLCRQGGFASVELDWRSVPVEQDRLEPVEGPPALVANIAKLNELLFGPQDYALIATR